MNRLPSANTSAGGMTSTPSLRKLQAPTSKPSRLSPLSHRMVASEPVTERFSREVDPDQDGAGEPVRPVGDLHGAARDEGRRQIVHQVADKGDEDASSPGRLSFRLFGRPRARDRRSCG
jgi:hypothetical protein